MPVIIFSKRTGKYLRRHSGSFRNLIDKIRYKAGRETIESKFGERPSWKGKDKENFNTYQRKVCKFCEDLAFCVKPEDARVYDSRGSATPSVGVFNTNWRKGRIYELPDHLEIHEIKESFVCIIRPDGSSNCDDEETS